MVFVVTWCSLLRGVLQEKEVRLKENFRGWGEKGKDLVGGFMSLFGRDGRIVRPSTSRSYLSLWCLVLE